MAFLHLDGLVPSWNQAMSFAGTDGRIATLPDVIDARISTSDDDTPWSMYFTTLTAEYFGYSKGGKRILIVAHGVGPMSTLEGIKQAYSFQYKDKTRDHRGGRITKEQFADLESGKYGEVSIVDFDRYFNRYEFPFHQKLRVNHAKMEPLVHARLGSRAEEYLECHGKAARKYHEENHHDLRMLSPYIISMEDDSNCFYGMRKDYRYRNSEITSPFLDKDGLPLAHLLSISQISYSHGNTENRFPDFHCDISCHGWNNGTRLIGVRKSDQKVDSIHPGIEPRLVLQEHWRELFTPTSHNGCGGGFHTLLKFGGGYFTMYPKSGETMDTGEPEFMVTKYTQVRGGPDSFRTPGYGSPFFKYGVKEVSSIAPTGANAYLRGEPFVDGDDHVCPLKFYKVEVDFTKRLKRASEILNNFDLLMSFL